jgi:hypothetical protein
MQKIERLISTVDVMYFKHACVYCIPLILYVKCYELFSDGVMIAKFLACEYVCMYVCMNGFETYCGRV